jgi:hypothetical protein
MATAGLNGAGNAPTGAQAALTSYLFGQTGNGYLQS